MEGTKELWFVMEDYNDDNEPYHVFRSLAEVRKAYYKKRLTKNHDGSYEFRNERKRFLVQTLEQVELKDLQYYGFVDSREREAHYWSLVYTWHSPEIFDNRGADRRLMKYAEDHRDTVDTKDADTTFVFGNYWGKMLDRFEQVFAPIKPQSKEEAKATMSCKNCGHQAKDGVGA
jgi:hypothetical protein